MKRDFYVLFSSIEEATAFSTQIAKRLPQLGPVWDEPRLHPTENRALIAWNETVLAPVADLLEGRQKVSEREAVAQGWIFHAYFRGTFAAARAKLEDAQLIADAMRDMADAGNFAAWRALFSGFLASLYALKNSLWKTSDRLGSQQSFWWSEKFKDIKSDPIVSALYNLNNSIKHEPRVVSPIESARIFQFANNEIGASPLLSREGAHRIVGRGTARERRIPTAGAQIQVQLVLHDEKGNLLGDANHVLERALRFYEDLVFEARVLFERDPSERRALDSVKAARGEGDLG